MLACLVAGVIASADALVDFVEPAWRAAPDMRIEDAYKWLFHATRGAEHAITNPEGPRRWLQEEWSALEPATDAEPTVERLDPQGRVLRIHLRPYKDRGGNFEMLLAVFITSAQRFKAPRSAFVEAWTTLGRRLSHKPIGRIDARSWVRLDAQARSEGYPAIHHSEQFERAQQPAYRVVQGDLWLAP